MEIAITLLVGVAVIVVLYIIFKVFKLVTRILVFALFLGIAYITNPGLEKHQAAAMARAEKDDIKIRSKHIATKDLKVFSLTQYVKDEDSPRTVGFGVFTRVWIFRPLK